MDVELRTHLLLLLRPLVLAKGEYLFHALDVVFYMLLCVCERECVCL